MELNPESGRATAAELKKLGAKKILIKAAEQGYITELACQMPKCFCPEELGGTRYFEPVTAELSPVGATNDAADGGQRPPTLTHIVEGPRSADRDGVAR